MTNSKRLSPISLAPLNITTLLLLMGCAGIGRTGKPDSVTFDAETVSLPAFDENTTVLSGTIVHEPKVEIDAREAVFSIRDAGALDGVLDIDPQTGVVTVTQDLTPDHEVQSEFEFTIVASFGNKESTQTVKVFVNDLNDVAPIFNALSPQAVSVNEDGKLVIPEHTNFAEAVTAIADVDGATVSYAIESGEDSSLLQIDENGILSLRDEEGLDWETDVDNREFAVNVIATVGDLSTKIGVSFVVQNVNDVPPTITSSATANALIENTLYDTDAVVYSATGTFDVDPIIWSLTGTDAALFAIDASTGEVRFASDTTPDHEAKSSYSFTIVATSGALTADTLDVTMAVTDLNDVDPVITSSATADALIDNTAYDTSHVVYTATGTFDDAVTGIVWSLTGTDAALFNIDASNGEVTFKAATTPDHETKTSYDFTVVATTGTGTNQLTDSQDVSVSVTDINDVDPVITSSATAAALVENTSYDTSHVVYQATGTFDDAISGIVWSLTGTDEALFDIDASNGAVTFTAETTPDHEVKNSYSFDVVATTGAGSALLTATKTVTVSVTDLNDVDPVITSSATADALTDNTAYDTSHVVYQATGTFDDAVTGIVWSLTGTDSSLFDIASDGKVTFKTDTTADHETNSDGYSFNVVATTGTGADEISVTKDVIVAITDINDVAPTITSAATATALVENTAYDTNHVLYTATGTYDITAITWSLSGTDAGLFDIGASNGEVTFKADTTANHEAKSGYSFNVVATSGSLPAVSKAVTIDVPDVNEAPTVNSSVTIPGGISNQAYSLAFAPFFADQDEGDTLTYSSSNLPSGWSITNGAITNATPTAGSYTITVTATDSGGLTVDHDVAITVVDVTISFANEVSSINEGENVGAQDLADVSVDNAAFTTLSVDDDRFEVSGGKLKTKADADFDFESGASVDVAVSASNGTTTVSKTFTLNLTDINDEAPTITSAATATALVENTAYDTNHVLYTAAGTYDITPITWSLSGTDAGLFDIGASNGEVTFKADTTANHEAKSSYSFNVVATSGSLPAVSKAVTIDVPDVNEAPTVNSSVTIPGGISNQAYSLALAPFFADQDDGDTLTYSSSNLPSGWSITNGAITNATPTAGSYTITVTATDSGGLTVDHDVAITVVDVTISFANEVSSINEGENVGAQDLADVSVDNAGFTTFSVDDDRFEISGGKLKTKADADFDFESGASVDVEVSASNGTTTVSKTFTLNLTDINDVAPVITSAATATALVENTLYNTSDVLYTATGTYDVTAIAWSLTGTDAGLFDIGASNGEVTFKADTTADHETKASYSFNVVATSGSLPAVSKAVTIDVPDVNEAPTVNSSVTIPDGVSIDGYRFDVSPLFSDQDDGDTLTYTPNNLPSGWSLTNGILTHAAPAEGSYTISVTATDGDGLTASHSFTVTVIDVTMSFANEVTSLNEGENVGVQDLADVSVNHASFTDFYVNDTRFEIVGGKLKTKADSDFDFEAGASIDVSVSATNGAAVISKIFTLTLTDINDEAPVFTSGATATALVENTLYNTSAVVYQAAATADVAGETISWSLSGADADNFDISTDGAVTFKADTTPDHEVKDSYQFTILASSGSSSEASQEVQIAVQDVNEAPRSNASATIADGVKDVPYHLSLSTLFTDPDEGDSLSFSASYLPSGWYITNGFLRHDAPAAGTYNFSNIQANDSGTFIAYRSFTVKILDVEVSFANQVTSIDEGFDVGVIDLADVSVNLSTFTLFSVNDERFEVVGGKLKTKADADFDFETEPSVNVTVSAFNGYVYVSKIFTLTVNDIDTVPPTITSGEAATALVDNTAYDTSYVVYQATGTYEVMPITWSLTGADASLFSIASNGEVTFTADTTADHETKSSYSFNVVATTGSLAPATQAVTVAVTDINDDAPVITSGATGTALVDNTAYDNAYIVYQATGTHDDAVEGIDWSLTGTDAAFFTIGSTGAVTFKGSTVANYEAKNSYSFTVVATTGTDSDTLSASKDITVAVADINDVAPVITSAATADALTENTSYDTNHVIYTATGTYDDAVSGISWSLTGADADLFSIAANGEVTFKADTAPDYEAKTGYSFAVVATTGTGSETLSASKDITVAVTDLSEGAPTITSAATGDALTENTSYDANHVVYQAAATAAQAGDVISWSLSGADAGLFDIAANGDVTFKADTTPDHETKAVYSFNVVATAGTGNSIPLATKAVTVSVTDINDVAPVITSGASGALLVNGTAVDTNFIIYEATAIPDVAGALVTWSLSGADSSLFVIASNGQVTFTSGTTTDSQTKSNYNFNVIATTGTGSNALTASQAVTANVVSSFEAPTITSGATGHAITEKTLYDTSYAVYQATGTYDDALRGITWSLTGADADLFNIAANGEVTFKVDTTPDYETKTGYSFTVVGTAGAGSAAMTVTKAVSVAVTDVNDEPPVITSSSTATALVENTTYGTTHIIYQATGTHDAAVNGIIWSLGGTDAGLFDIASNGLVTFKNATLADHEAKPNYSFDVVATTGTGTAGVTSFSATKTVTVSVTDINDVAPTITSGATGTALIDNQAYEASYIVYQATGTFDVTALAWSLTGTDADLFSISASGEVTFKDQTTPDYETNTDGYRFNVVATSGELPAISQAVSIAIVDVNDLQPQIYSKATGAALAENTTYHSYNVIYTALAGYEEDSAELSWSLSGADAALFTINDEGQVTFKATTTPDHEAQERYSFNVIATTSTKGTNTEILSATQAVTIDVTDLNDAPTVRADIVIPDLLVNSATTFDVSTLFSDQDDGDVLTYQLTTAVSGWTLTNGTLSGTTAATTGQQAFALRATDNAGAFVDYDLVFEVKNIVISLPLTATALTDNDDYDTSHIVYTAQGEAAPSKTISWSLSGKHEALFDIDPSTGEISFVTQTTADHEQTNGQYEVIITASDGENTTSKTVIIPVTDVNETAPIFEVGSVGLLTIEEGSVSFDPVTYHVTADVQGSVRFSLEDAVAGSQDSEAFVIDAHTGVLSAAANAVFSKDTQSQFSFKVIATAGTQASEYLVLATVEVQETDIIIDDTPIFSQGAQTITVDENSALPATHYVANSAAGRAATFTLEGADADLFDLSEAGFLTAKETTSFDHEAKASYALTITATSPTGETASRNVTITVNDVNDIAPVITSAATGTALTDNQSYDTTHVIYSATGTHDDAITALSWAIKGRDADVFTIDEATGEVTFKQTTIVDFERQEDGYHFTVEAISGQLPRVSQDVHISITNVAELAPVITSSEVGTALLDGASFTSANVIYQAEGTYDAAPITWSLEGSDAALFSINEIGEVRFANPSVTADITSKDVYDFTIVATSATFTTKKDITVAVYENSDSQTDVYRLSSSSWSGTDGEYHISDFDIGSDKFIFFDLQPGSGIASLGDFITGLIAAGGSINLHYRSAGATAVDIVGFDIVFPLAVGESEAVTIDFDFKSPLAHTATFISEIGNVNVVSSTSSAAQIARIVTFLTDEIQGDDGQATFTMINDADDLPPEVQRGDVWFGNDEADSYEGTKWRDFINAGEGDDVITSHHGLIGGDIIIGGSGNDLLEGHSGDDYLDAGSGDDILEGYSGTDVIDGGYGFDTVTLGAGNDTVVMRFNSDSDSSGTWRMDDGGDVIYNFKRGEDKLVFVDMVDKTGASPITSFSQWLADDNRPEVSLVYDTSDIAQGNLGIKAVKLHFGSPGGSTGPNTGSNESSIVTINFDPTGTYYTLNATTIGTHTKNNSPLLSDTGLQVLDEILGGTDAFESFHVIDDSDLPSVLTIL